MIHTEHLLSERTRTRTTSKQIYTKQRWARRYIIQYQSETKWRPLEEITPKQELQIFVTYCPFRLSAIRTSFNITVMRRACSAYTVASAIILLNHVRSAPLASSYDSPLILLTPALLARRRRAGLLWALRPSAMGLCRFIPLLPEPVLIPRLFRVLSSAGMRFVMFEIMCEWEYCSETFDLGFQWFENIS